MSLKTRKTPREFALSDGECFALGRFGCNISFGLKCGENCRLRVSRTEFEVSRRKAYARLAALPEHEQRGIADKYYDGKMPWKE